MDQNNLQELRELVEFLKENGIAEFDMERSDLKVRLKFAGTGASVDSAQLAALLAASANVPAPVVMPAAAPAAAAPS